MERTIFNPIQKNAAIFLKTHADASGEYTQLEVEFAEGGGVGLHYHKTFSEKFECIQADVQVQPKKIFTHAQSRAVSNSDTKCHSFIQEQK